MGGLLNLFRGRSRSEQESEQPRPSQVTEQDRAVLVSPAPCRLDYFRGAFIRPLFRTLTELEETKRQAPALSEEGNLIDILELCQ